MNQLAPDSLGIASWAQICSPAPPEQLKSADSSCRCLGLCAWIDFLSNVAVQKVERFCDSAQEKSQGLYPCPEMLSSSVTYGTLDLACRVHPPLEAQLLRHHPLLHSHSHLPLHSQRRNRLRLLQAKAPHLCNLHNLPPSVDAALM